MTGSLDDIRDASRAAVHAKFRLPVVVTRLDGSSVGNAYARLHLADSRPFGDLDREGFAFAIEGKVQIVFDTDDMTPEEKYVVNFGRGRVYVIEAIIDSKQSTRYVRCVASEKKA